MNKSICALLLASFLTTSASYGAPSWTLVNPADETYVDEPVRLKLDLPDGAEAGKFVVLRDGRQVGYQVEEIDGRRWVWVAATLEPGQSTRYTVEKGTFASSVAEPSY